MTKWSYILAVIVMTLSMIAVPFMIRHDVKKARLEPPATITVPEVPAKVPETVIVRSNRFAFVPAVFYEQVKAVATEYGIPLYYFAKLLEVESGYNPKAVNYNDNGTIDQGIAQLNSAYLDEFAWRYGFGKIDPFDPMLAIRVAGKHISVLYANTGDWRITVAAYNCGLSRAKSGKWPTRTMNYVTKIFEEVQ